MSQAEATLLFHEFIALESKYAFYSTPKWQKKWRFEIVHVQSKSSTNIKKNVTITVNQLNTTVFNFTPAVTIGFI